jgi:hypothetical protein
MDLKHSLYKGIKMDDDYETVGENTTSIDFIGNEEDYSSFSGLDIEEVSKDEKSLLEHFYDPTISTGERRALLQRLITKDRVLVMDAVNNLCVSYLENHSSMLQKVIEELVDESELYFPLRMRCCETLLFSSEIKFVNKGDPDNPELDTKTTKVIQKEYLPHLVRLLYSVVYYTQEQQIESDVSFALIFEQVCLAFKLFTKPKENINKPNVLSERDDAYESKQNVIDVKDIEIDKIILDECSLKITSILRECVTNNFLKENYRYKLLKILYEDDHLLDSDPEINIDHFFFETARSFYISDLETIVHSIYICQMFKNREKLDCKMVQMLVERIDKAIDDNERADAADFLLSLKIYGEMYKDAIEFATKLLETLGGSKDVYQNKQNVHQVSFEMEKFLDHLATVDQPIDKDEMIADIQSRSTTYCSCIDKVVIALNRIKLDNGLYGKNGMTLYSILHRLYNYIQIHNDKKLLNERLIDELLDMSETCSTGHLIRLANILSGIDLNFVQMSVKDEIRAVIHYRFKKYFEGMEEEKRDAVMDDLLEQTLGGAVQKYMFRYFSELHDELERDYVHAGIVNDQEFTEYYRDSIMTYFDLNK